MFKILKINPRTKIVKLNNLMLSPVSMDYNINKVLYSFDFRDGIINNVPANIIDLVFFSDNGFVYDYYEEQKTLLQSILDKKVSGISQKVILTFLQKIKSGSSPFTISLQFNNTILYSQSISIPSSNKFVPIKVVFDQSNFPSIDQITMFKIIIDNRLIIKNLQIYEFDHYEPSIYITFPSKINNIMITPFGIQQLKNINIVSEFTLLDTLNYQKLLNYMDFTPPNGQTPTYTSFITVKDENTVGPQYYQVLYRNYKYFHNEGFLDYATLINYEIQNPDNKYLTFFSRSTKQFKNKKYKTKIRVRKISNGTYNKEQHSIYHGFNSSLTLEVNRNIGFGSSGTFDWYPVIKYTNNIPTTYEEWISPTFGYNTDKLIPSQYYYHSVGVILNYQYPDTNVDQKFQINLLEIFEVDDNDKRIDVEPLISLSTPSIYSYFNPLYNSLGNFSVSYIDLLTDIEFYRNSETLTTNNTLNYINRQEQIDIESKLKIYYNKYKSEFNFSSSNDYILVKNIVNTSPDSSFFHFKIQSKQSTNITVDFLNQSNNSIYQITINITSDKVNELIPVNLVLSSSEISNVKYIRFNSSTQQEIILKEIFQYKINSSLIPLDYFNNQDIITYNNITSVDNIILRGVDWIQKLFNLDKNIINELSVEQIILPQNGIHIFKRNLDNLISGKTYTFYIWIKNNYSGVSHQILTHDDQNYQVLTTTKVIDWNGWELVKQTYTPNRNVKQSYMIYRDGQNYNTDIYLFGLSVVENPLDLPLLNTPSQIFDGPSYIEFPQIYIPNNGILSIDFSHQKTNGVGKSILCELEDSSQNSFYLYIQNNELYSSSNTSTPLINNITLGENKIYNLSLIFTTTQINIKIKDIDTGFDIQNQTINTPNLILNDLFTIRLGDSKNNITEYYSCNFINMNVLTQ